MSKMQFFFLVLTSCYISAFEPISKDEQIERMKRVNDETEPFRRNLTECAKQTKAASAEVERFLKRIPQATDQGKCFVACILRRNSIIVKNKIVEENLLEANRAVYGDDSEVLTRLKSAVSECKTAVDGVFEICEYASMFNDCMHIKMEHILDKLTMERRMEALGQMSSEPDSWNKNDDEMMQMLREEL